METYFKKVTLSDVDNGREGLMVWYGVWMHAFLVRLPTFDFVI